LKGGACACQVVGEGERELRLFGEWQDGDARVVAEACEEGERGFGLLRDVFAGAARGVEGEEQRDALRADGKIVYLDGLPAVAYLKILRRKTRDALPALVGDEDGDGDQVGSDADDLVIIGRGGRLRRSDARVLSEAESVCEKKEKKTVASGACGNVSPETGCAREGHAAEGLEKESPEEQYRQDDGNRDDDDFYETHDLILKEAGNQ
jgi:hypothetical protein